MGGRTRDRKVVSVRIHLGRGRGVEWELVEEGRDIVFFGGTLLLEFLDTERNAGVSAGGGGGGGGGESRRHILYVGVGRGGPGEIAAAAAAVALARRHGRRGLLGGGLVGCVSTVE